MKNFLLFLLLLVSCGNVSYAQKQSQVNTTFGTATITVSPLKAYFAKAVQVETKPNSVIVFLEGEEKESKIGLNVTVVSSAKFNAMFAIKKSNGDFTALSTKVNGDFYFFGTPGKYTLVLSESDPDKGQSFSSIDGEIEGMTVTVGNFDKLIEVTKQASDKLNDKETSKALSNAYIKAVEEMKTLPNVDACIELSKSYRRAVFAAMAREKRSLDWNGFVKSVDVELQPFQSSVEAYSSALSAVAQTLSK